LQKVSQRDNTIDWFRKAFQSSEPGHKEIMKPIPSTDLREDFSSWQCVESESVGQNIPQVTFNFIGLTPYAIPEWIHC
jgi:hypothetical protein